MDRFGCAIDMEPKTEGELHNAREEAIVIIRSNEPVEASIIFTQDMQPVTSPKRCTDQKGLLDQKGKFHGLAYINEDSSWDCSPPTTTPPDLNNLPKLKEPLSSPF